MVSAEIINVLREGREARSNVIMIHGARGTESVRASEADMSARERLLSVRLL